MSEGHVVTARQVKNAANNVVKAMLVMNKLSFQFNKQQEEEGEEPEAKPKAEKKKKESKKREAPEIAEKKEEKKKEKKEKPEGWLCSGNVAEGTPCELSEEKQEYPGSGTRYKGETHNVCKVCKKAVEKARAAEKKKE